MAGISFLIFGTNYTVTYYVYQCREALFNFYIFTGVLSCGSSFVINLLPSMHTPQNKTLKALIFLATGCINFLSLIHAMLLGFRKERFDDLEIGKFHLLVTVGCFFYVFGVIFYVTKFPERSFPRRFDIWLNSHAIFHFFVALAAFTVFRGL